MWDQFAHPYRTVNIIHLYCITLIIRNTSFLLLKNSGVSKIWEMCIFSNLFLKLIFKNWMWGHLIFEAIEAFEEIMIELQNLQIMECIEYRKIRKGSWSEKYLKIQMRRKIKQTSEMMEGLIPVMLIIMYVVDSDSSQNLIIFFKY